ncbi:hypothetical protein CC79DRAFT_1367597 [Sarocladium strictum]
MGHPGQTQKRQRANDPLRADIDPPAKDTKTESELERKAWESWEYPPEFYDRLSTVSLNRRALKELDRRTRVRRSHPSPPPVDTNVDTTRFRDMAQFARHGGPDLRDLRGYPHPPSNLPPSVAMSASQSWRNPGTKSIDPASTIPTTFVTTKTKKSAPHNRDFDLHLTEQLVHPVYSSQEPDLEEVMAAMAVRRGSLAPSHFSNDTFKAFQERNFRARDEDDVLATVIPTILGPNYVNRNCARNTVFNNLEPLTDGTITVAQPDLYWGAESQQLARPARNELADHVVPSTMFDKPLAPNVFLEVKGPAGDMAVATRQVRYDGAIGSRAMHSLQNYSMDEPQYDGKPRTFSFTYFGGLLQEYAHHITAPTSDGGRPEYHMTQVNAWGMTGNRDTCVEGIRAFRNTLDFAEQQRSELVRAANARAARPSTAVAGQEHTTAGSQSTSPTSIASRFIPQSQLKRQQSPCSDGADGHASRTRSRSEMEAESSTATTGLVAAGTGELSTVRRCRKKRKLRSQSLQEQEAKVE